MAIYQPPYYGQNYGSYMPSAMPQAIPQMQMQQPPQAQNNGIVWVQGETGAKGYLVGAGNSVLLMDSESTRFYIKSSDASGMPLPLRIFEYKEIQSGQNVVQTDYIKRDEFDALKAIVDELKKEDNSNGNAPV